MPVMSTATMLALSCSGRSIEMKLRTFPWGEALRPLGIGEIAVPTNMSASAVFWLITTLSKKAVVPQDGETGCYYLRLGATVLGHFIMLKIILRSG